MTWSIQSDIWSGLIWLIHCVYSAVKNSMYSTTLATMLPCHRGQARMRSPALAFDSAVHGCWYISCAVCSECVDVGGCVCVWSGGYRGQQLWADSSPQRLGARCQGNQGNVCGHTRLHATHQHTMSSDLKGHLLWSGSVAASAQSSSKISPRQPRHIIPFHLIPCTNRAQRDWPVSPGGPEATAQALSAYSQCQRWLWVRGRGASRTLKERLVHFGRRRCELCRRTPTVCVWVCVCNDANLSPSRGTIWEERATLYTQQSPSLV